MRAWSARTISGVVATGYGRNAIRFADTTITEITCHARGVHHAGAGRAHDHRNRRPGQQGHQSRRRRAGPGFCDERPLRGGHGTFSGNGRRPAGHGLGKAGRTRRAKAKSPRSSATCAWCSPRRRSSACWPKGKPLPDVVAGVQNAIATRVVGAGRAFGYCRRFISPAASRCNPAWPARWRKFWPVRSVSRRTRNSPARSAQRCWLVTGTGQRRSVNFPFLTAKEQQGQSAPRSSAAGSADLELVRPFPAGILR